MPPYTLLPSRTASCLSLLAAFLLVSCSGPRVEMLDRPVTETKASRAMTNSSALDVGTRDTLREEDLADLYKSDDGEAIRTLAQRYKKLPTEARRRALAELSSDRADRITAQDRTAAIGHYLDAAQLTDKANLAAVGQAGESLDRTLYNYCAARVARLIHDQADRQSMSISAPGSLRNWHLTLASGNGAVDPRHYDIVVPASWLKAKGIKWKPISQEGLGMPMVGYRKATPERKAADPMTPPGGRGFPLNASFRLSGDSATLILQDLMTTSNATIAGRSLPLAGDFSAALSFTYYERTGGMNKMAALLRPGQFSDMIGMYTVQPFTEDKIPLILVHGLMSSAEAWLPFVNLLLADPVVREKYQIILFNYPTGNSIMRNAANLRDALAQLQKRQDPGRRNPRMRKMVILGHSMGGIISNAQIRDSGDRIYRTILTTDLEELELEEETEAEIRRLAFFEANPDISRALLLAAPLRGSEFATNRLGQFGAWLIRMPLNLVDSVLGSVEFIDVMTDVGQEASQRPVNSVTGLRPDNPTLQNILDSPVGSGVRIHSIIAQKNPKVPLLESSDGVVPYTSAHLDEAKTEKIILNANHRNMVERDETVDEVLRILYLHAGLKFPSQPRH
jgi:triacylglycerol esterase/lipase EstA (alpha/beta hydrolase family)